MANKETVKFIDSLFNGLNEENIIELTQVGGKAFVNAIKALREIGCDKKIGVNLLALENSIHLFHNWLESGRLELKGREFDLLLDSFRFNFDIAHGTSDSFPAILPNGGLAFRENNAIITIADSLGAEIHLDNATLRECLSKLPEDRISTIHRTKRGFAWFVGMPKTFSDSGQSLVIIPSDMIRLLGFVLQQTDLKNIGSDFIAIRTFKELSFAYPLVRKSDNLGTVVEEIGTVFHDGFPQRKPSFIGARIDNRQNAMANTVSDIMDERFRDARRNAPTVVSFIIEHKLQHEYVPSLVNDINEFPPIFGHDEKTPSSYMTVEPTGWQNINEMDGDFITVTIRLIDLSSTPGKVPGSVRRCARKLSDHFSMDCSHLMIRDSRMPSGTPETLVPMGSLGDELLGKVSRRIRKDIKESGFQSRDEIRDGFSHLDIVFFLRNTTTDGIPELDEKAEWFSSEKEIVLKMEIPKYGFSQEYLVGESGKGNRSFFSRL